MSFIQHSLYLASAAGDAISGGAQKACGSTCGGDINTIFTSISNALIFIVGAVSVIMIIVGGLRYVLSSGDPKAISAAKDTILYAVIGIIVAIAAFGIVSFVTKNF